MPQLIFETFEYSTPDGSVSSKRQSQVPLQWLLQLLGRDRPFRMAGYSGTPLDKKLDIRPKLKAYLYETPTHLKSVFSELEVSASLRPTLEYVHVFVTEREKLTRLFPKIDRALADDGVVWISWPKKSARVPTTLDEGTVRELGLKTRLVDVKVCAVDEIWSGLKFVRRREHRT